MWTLWRSQESLTLAGNWNTIPQPSPWPSHYRPSHLGSSVVLEELVVLLVSLMLIISSEAQWCLLFEEFQLLQCASVQTWLLERNLELGSVLGIIHAHKVCKMLLPRTFPYLFRLTTKARTKARDTTSWKGLLLIHYAVASRSVAYIITVDRRVTGPGMSKRAPH